MPASSSPAESATMCSPVSAVNDLALRNAIRGFPGGCEGQLPRPARTLRAAVAHALNAVGVSYPTAQSLTAARPKPTGGEHR
jgi:hypothetical protein